MLCPKCKKETPDDKQFCQECLFNIGYWETYGVEWVQDGRKVPLSLNSLDPKYFMRTDRAWDKDIKSRRTLPNGKVVRTRR